MTVANHMIALDVALSAFDEGVNGRSGMEAAIRAYLDARGLVMVPKEPTEGMTKAAMDALDIPFYADLDRAYIAMLAMLAEVTAPFKDTE